MKKAAVIGLGDISATHLTVIEHSPEIELVALCDTQEAARAKAPAGVPFFSDFEEMIRTVCPDCVHICLPHYLHYPVARRAAELGCNVFTEKPLAISTAQAAEFAALEQAFPALRFGICLQNRYNPTIVQLKKIIDGGEYGALVGLKGLVPWYRPKDYYDTKPWRGILAQAGSGTLMNQSIHTLDLLYFLGGPIARLHASMSQLLDYGIETEDTVTARIEYESGIRGLFWATLCNYGNESVQVTVALEKAVFHIEDGVLTRRDPDGTRTPICEDAKRDGATFYYGSSHMTAIHHFYNALETGCEDYIHASDGVMSVGLIDAIFRSAGEDRLVDVG